jgi:CelD/BcsL family acetyltransferase involved in cellulose biosynthesis
MRIQVIQVDELSDELAARWGQIQRTNAYLISPFFSLQFTQAVAYVRNDVRVAVMRQHDQVVGFFPFHQSGFRIARPIGLGLSDFHGMIVEPDLNWSAEDLLAGCNQVRWRFDHLVCGQAGFDGAANDWQPSPQIRTDIGWDGYQQQLDTKARKQFKESQRKLQKLQQDHGAIRFEQHTDSTDVLNAVFALKSHQCRETGVTDYFSFAWTTALIRKLHSIQDADFQGVLSCLYVGDQLAAVHFGIRTDRAWHFWFPAYTDQFSAYSPGLILLYEIIRAAATSGIQHIDLGKGVSTYKERVMNDQVLVGSGCVQRPSLLNRLISCAESLEARRVGWCLQPVLNLPGRVVRRVARQHRFR